MKSKTKKADYCQAKFDSHYLANGDAHVRLREQWDVIGRFAWPPTVDDPEALRALAAEVDVPLLRFSLSLMRSQMEEAAAEDTSSLIAELVLDTSQNNEARKRLEAWLDTAPCWPTLAKDNWSEAVRKAGTIVIETLTEAGVQLDAKSEAELAKQVGALSIEDLLPKETMERLFPVEPEEREW